MTRSGSRPKEWCVWSCPIPVIHAVPDIRQSSNRRTGLLAVEGPIRDDVFDLTARHADIHELPVVQAVQLGAFPLSFAPFFAPCLKRTPISLEKAGDAPRRCGRLSQPCCTIGRAHAGISWGAFLSRRGCQDMGRRA